MEYSAHIVLAYLESSDAPSTAAASESNKDSDVRLARALGTMALPTVNGAVSSFVGIFALAFGQPVAAVLAHRLLVLSRPFARSAASFSSLRT